MIIEQRTYQLRPGTTQEFLKNYEAEGLEIQRDALGNLVGFFSTEFGTLNCIVQLWAFSSYEDRVQRKAQLAANPKWREFAGKNIHMIESQTSVILNPARFSPIQ